MIALAMQSTLILGLAFAAAVLIHRRGASLHRLLWLAALGALALLPALRLAPQAITVEAPVALASVVMNVTEATAVETPRNWVFLAWVAGCAVFLFRIAMGLAVIAWRTAQAEVAPYRVEGARVLLSRHVDSPFTWGALRRTVLLPVASTGWSEDRLRSMLAHESVHVARRDALWRLLSQVVCAFYWPNPLAWMAAGRLHAAMEQSCDDAVLETGVGAREYAGHLLEVSRAASLGEVAAGTVAMAGAAQLEARLRSILDGSRRRAPVSRTASWAAALAALAVLTPFGVMRLTAQNAGSASLSGVITDVSGARVPKALVTLSESKTGKVEAVYAGDDGSYVFKSIPAGEYTLQVRKAGFAPWVEKLPRQLKGGDAVTAHAVLNVGQIREMIDVVGTRVTTPPAPSSGPPVRLRIGGNVQAAKLAKMVKPAYPDTAKARNAEGPVLLRAVITREGDVASLDVLNTSADQELAQAAMDAVKQWKYETTRLNGVPVEVVTEITINFSLAK